MVGLIFAARDAGKQTEREREGGAERERLSLRRTG